MASSPDRDSSPDWLKEFKSPMQDGPVTLSSSPSLSLSPRKPTKSPPPANDDTSSPAPTAPPEKRRRLASASRAKQKISYTEVEDEDLNAEEGEEEGGRPMGKRARVISDDDEDDDDVIGFFGKKGGGVKEEGALELSWSPPRPPPMATKDLKTKGTPKVSAGEGEGSGGRGGVGVADAALKVEKDEEGEGETEVVDGAPDVGGAEGVGGDRRPKQRAASSLPLMLPEKIHRTKVLVECDGERATELDLGGDVGAVGRFSVRKDLTGKGKVTGKKAGGEGEEGASKEGERDLLLDMKGVIYKATIIPTNTFFIVNVGQTEAKVEAIMNDFVQLQEEANVYAAETMVEGTLDGWDFGSDDEQERAAKTGKEGPSGAVEGEDGADGNENAKAKKGTGKAKGGAGAKAKESKPLVGARASKAGLGGIRKRVAKPKAKGKAKAKPKAAKPKAAAKPRAKATPKAKKDAPDKSRATGKAREDGKAPSSAKKAKPKATPKKRKLASSDSETDPSDDIQDSDWSG